jgi:hypothetical protein
LVSLAVGLGLAVAGYLLQQPVVAAGGVLASAAGLYAERSRARSLRRRRRAERIRSRHEVTELRRTIAQLRGEVEAFRRALLDTEVGLAGSTCPLPDPVAVPAVREPGQPVAAHPAEQPVPPPHEEEHAVVVPLAQAEAENWVQVRARDAAENAPLPAQQLGASGAAVTGSLPVMPPLTVAAGTLVHAAAATTATRTQARSPMHDPDADDAEVAPVAPVPAEPTRRVA